MDLLHGGSGSSANSVTHGGRGGGGHGNYGNGAGRGRGRGHGNSHSNGGHHQPHHHPNADRPTFQLCGKEGHTILRYYKRFDVSFCGLPENRFASAATTSYGVDTNWYVDTGATDHITSELEKLTI